ncbi:MAG: nucleotidyltransferase domain-containing protein [Planctomycetota bacterium]
MDPNSWRKQAAARLTSSLRNTPQIGAVILGGSVARGWADSYSDLELGVFWTQPPKDEVRLRLLSETRPERIGGFRAFDPSPRAATGTEDNLLVHGFQVDLCHHLIDRVDDWITNVVSEADTSLEKQTLVSTIQHAQPLHNETWLTERQAQVADYPDQLAKETLRQNYPFFFQKHMEYFIARDEVTLFYNYLTGLQKRIFTTIVALNRRYFAGFKRMARQVESMERTPSEMIERFERCYGNSIADAWTSTEALVSEVVELATAVHPDVDSKRPREQAYRRKGWDTPPQGFGDLRDQT